MKKRAGMKMSDWVSFKVYSFTLSKLSALFPMQIKYIRTAVARTRTGCIACLTRTRSWVHMIPYMRLLSSNFYIYVFHAVIFIFYF